MNYIKLLAVVIDVVSFFIVVMFGIFGLYEQVMGPEDAKKLLKKFKSPLSYNMILRIGFGAIIILISSRIIQMRMAW